MAKRVHDTQKPPLLPQTRRERGIALAAVLVMLVMISLTVADFSFNSLVDYSSAGNARDELRAQYLARSSVNLSKLLLKVQESLIDPNQKLFGGLDLQIADYAPFLVSAFNSADGAASLGSLLGINADGIKGIGIESGSFDLEMESLDGKVNLNCGGGTNTGADTVTRFAQELAMMFYPERYNRLFEEPDEDGQFVDRVEQLRAIIDWADQDTVIYGGSAGEDYGYNARKSDRYEIKNHYYDTVQELRLVEGVDEDFMAAFGDQFTVYGDCKVNVGLADAPTLAALIMQFAENPQDPALRWDNLALLVRYVMQVRGLTGGFKDVQAFQKAVEDPLAQLGVASLVDSALGGSAGQDVAQSLLPVVGLKLKGEIKDAILTAGPRRIWRIVASAEVGRVKKRLVTVYDTKLISAHASPYDTGAGGFVYWREE